MRKSERKNTRDKLIVESFYKLYDVEMLRMDKTLAQLSDEIFFLDPDYIYAVIFYNEKNKEYYDNLVNGTLKIPKRKLLKAVSYDR